MQTPIDILTARLDLPAHQQAIRELTAAYALDVMGNGGPLPDDVLDRLIPGLQGLPTTLVILAYAGSTPIGIATCFRGFTTFLGRPLINVHDLFVQPAWQGRKIGKMLLEAVEAEARATGCGRLTLEVQENNVRARRTYASCGFAHSVLGETTGGTLFYVKRLT